MNQPITFFIENNGSVVFLKSPRTAGFDLGPSITKRASHVYPARLSLRLAFKALRRLFGDTGRVAEATRGWKTLWMADMRPTGGPILPGRWADRHEAINAEIAYFNDHGVQQ